MGKFKVCFIGSVTATGCTFIARKKDNGATADKAAALTGRWDHPGRTGACRLYRGYRGITTSSQTFVPLIGRLLVGSVPPWQGELIRVTVRDWLPESPWQILAGLSPVQLPVDHWQVGRQFLVPERIVLIAERCRPRMGC